jgi:hypothetical protein
MKPFSLDRNKDIKLIGKTYTLKGIGEGGKDLKGKFVSIDLDGRYEFAITTRDSDLEMYMTGAPNDGEIE